ncbi:MAG TPA: chromate resistance protein [Hyphomicrobiaceae bacterium]|nr:chromate resistance protein [Hyphomicrobiaceae bacterium]
MPSPNEIPTSTLGRLIGTPECPVIVDVRIHSDFEADPRLIPASVRLDYRDVASWARDFGSRSVVVSCQKGLKLSQGVAAWLRHEGVGAEYLDGGFDAWKAAGLPLLDPAKLGHRDTAGRTVWVTRTRPKIDRIACPWLIRRFIDPDAVFLFVAPSEVEAVAERFAATPFDIENVFWSHRGERCTFDTMLDEFGLRTRPLCHLADIIRGADTARLDLTPQSAGLLAVSLGYSRMYRDDLEQLTAAMTIYDALYRWCRDATSEAHDWPSRPAVSP